MPSGGENYKSTHFSTYVCREKVPITICLSANHTLGAKRCVFCKECVGYFVDGK